VGRVRGPLLILCVAASIAGCGGDDETTVVETTTVTTIETVPTAPGGRKTDDAGAGVAEPARRCGRIAFNPSTDSGAASITAVGIDCETARAVARAARNATDELSYEVEGFRCVGTRSEGVGLAWINWFCVGANREAVNFETT
jgi:hypothetical protein